MESAVVANLCQRSLKNEGGRCNFSPRLAGLTCTVSLPARLAAVSSLAQSCLLSSCQCQLSPATCSTVRGQNCLLAREERERASEHVRVSPQNNLDGYSKLSSQPRVADRPVYSPLTPSCYRSLLRNQETSPTAQNGGMPRCVEGLPEITASAQQGPDDD